MSKKQADAQSHAQSPAHLLPWGYLHRCDEQKNSDAGVCEAYRETIFRFATATGQQRSSRTERRRRLPVKREAGSAMRIPKKTREVLSLARANLGKGLY